MMTVTKTKFDDAKIYQIVDNTNSNVYIGSTCRTLKARLASHKTDYKRFLNGVIHNTRSFDIIKNNDYEIKLLEECEVKNKQELFARERFYIENNNCLNKCIPGRTGKQYYIDNKEKYKESRKTYYDNNKEKFKEYTKARYIANKERIKEQKNQKFECDCGGKYTNTNKLQHQKTAIHKTYLENLK